jgi:hypothetical protein
VLLTPTQLRGRTAIRVSIVSFRTHLAQIEDLLETIRAELTGDRV